MARPSFADQSLRRRLNGHRAWSGPQRQPDRARRTSLERTPVVFRPDAPCSRHPCVWHRFPPWSGGLDLAVSEYSHLLTPLAAISPEGEGRMQKEAIRSREEINVIDSAGPGGWAVAGVFARTCLGRRKPGSFLTTGRTPVSAVGKERPGAPLSPGLNMNDGCEPGPVHRAPGTFADLLSTICPACATPLALGLSEVNDMTLGQIVSPIPGHITRLTVRFWPKDRA